MTYISKAVHEKRYCKKCGKVFISSNNKQIYCSKKCNKSILNAKKHNIDVMKKGNNHQTDKAIVDRVRLRTSKFEYAGGWERSDGYTYLYCRDCGKTFRHSAIGFKPSKKANIQCGNCNNILLEIKNLKKEQKKREAYFKEFDKSFSQGEFRICPICKAVYVGCKKTCSSKCSLKNIRHIHEKKRRAKMKNAVVDKDISLYKLYERDNGICYLCGKKTSFEDYEIINGTVIVGNNYPSIDHVIPLSKSGKHSWENVKLSCFRCNTLKSDTLL